jgi:hypothetical protein
MKKHQVILSVGLLVMLFGVQTPQFAQDTTAGPAKAEQERHRVAIGLLRTINTAEVTYIAKNGSFGMWQALVSDQPECFDPFLAMLLRNGWQKADVHFSDAPEVLPGWTLRLNVHPEGQGYDVLLRDIHACPN